MKVFGLGFRPDTATSTLAQGLHFAVQRWGMPSRLAYPFFRADDAARLAELVQNAFELVQVDAKRLAAVQALCITHSIQAQASVGFSSVAEGCALAAMAPGARLVAPRQTIAGRVTIACAHGLGMACDGDHPS